MLRTTDLKTDLFHEGHNVFNKLARDLQSLSLDGHLWSLI